MCLERPPRLPLVLLSWWLRYLTGRRLPISEQGETDTAVADKCRQSLLEKRLGVGNCEVPAEQFRQSIQRFQSAAQ